MVERLSKELQPEKLMTMTKRVLLAIAGIFFFVGMLLAQDVPAGAIAAFKKGSSQELNNYLGDKVELIIQNRSAQADKKTTVGAMVTFFADNNVTGFNVNHQGKRDE